MEGLLLIGAAEDSRESQERECSSLVTSVPYSFTFSGEVNLSILRQAAARVARGADENFYKTEVHEETRDAYEEVITGLRRDIEALEELLDLSNKIVTHVDALCQQLEEGRADIIQFFE